MPRRTLLGRHRRRRRGRSQSRRSRAGCARRVRKTSAALQIACPGLRGAAPRPTAL